MGVQGGLADVSPVAATKLGRAELARQLAAARERLQPKLLHVDLAGIGLSPYNQRYLQHKLSVVAAELQQTSDLLTLVLAKSSVPLSEFALLDYGGGSGVISLLAKELGVGAVVYNDIYDVSCRDAELLAQAVGLHLDHDVCGDIDDVLAYLREHSLELNGVVSYDVLEHIYDIPAFFAALSTTPTSTTFFRLVMASGANAKNPRYVKHATNVHLTDELKGTEPDWGHKERDATRPFLEIRRELISETEPDLTPAQVDELARATRGQRRDDIERSVAEYVGSGSISYRPDHPTNTCDPYNGNWSEHLMEPGWLERVVRDAGFDARVRPGVYAATGTGVKHLVKRVLNVAIGALGARGLVIAPYYIVYGTKSCRRAAAEPHLPADGS